MDVCRGAARRLRRQSMRARLSREVEVLPQLRAKCAPKVCWRKIAEEKSEAHFERGGSLSHFLLNTTTDARNERAFCPK